MSVDTRPENYEYTAFPIGVLPDLLKSWVRETSRAIGCDCSYLALPLLVSLGSCLGAKYVVRLRRSWVEPSIFWGTIVGYSGPMKTPAQRQVLAPLHGRIERLERLRVSGEPLDADMSAWMEGLPNHLRDKLVAADLLHGTRAAAGKSINDHLADFAVSLRAKGDTEKRIRDVTGRVERILCMAGIKSLSGIDPTEVDKVLPRLADEGRVSSTIAGYVQSVKQFCDWTVQHGRMSRNPIKHLTVKDKGDRKKRRRPLTVDEVRTLVTTTADGPVRHGIDGPDQAVMYAFAAETGCRAGDVAALMVGDFDVGAGDDPVSFTIRSGTTKNRKERTLLLSPGLSVVMREYLAGKLPTAKAFKTPRTDAFAKMIRKGCKAVGIAVIDNAGREIDFHGLRVTSASLMISGGFDVKLAQQRLGHHDPALTLKVYAMTYREAEAAAVRRLPDLAAPRGRAVSGRRRQGRMTARQRKARQTAVRSRNAQRNAPATFRRVKVHRHSSWTAATHRAKMNINH